MKQKQIINLAWQFFVDKMTSGKMVTTDATVRMAGPSVAIYSGRLADAICSAMPALEPADMAAEELLEDVIVVGMSAGRLPLLVFSTTHVPEHNTHWSVINPSVTGKT